MSLTDIVKGELRKAKGFLFTPKGKDKMLSSIILKSSPEKYSAVASIKVPKAKSKSLL